MSSNVFLKFQKESTHPSSKEVVTILEDFFGSADVATVVEETQSLIMISLKGECSFPFKRLHQKADLYGDAPHPRWIELFRTSDGFIVTTRHQDEYVHSIVSGISALLARYYKCDISDD